MRKRIRLHQVRKGMFVEELEGAARGGAMTVCEFFIETESDLDRVRGSCAMSVVIDIKKGIDANIASGAVNDLNLLSSASDLDNSFSEEQIARARKTIEQTRPHVQNVLAQAQRNVFHFEAACQAVEKVMADALTNAGALIQLAKLKNKDESTFLHSVSVSALMIAFGRDLGFSGGTIHTLGVSGLVHDLGKMTLPVGLLERSGKLTPQEMSIIQTHPDRGYKILKRVPGVSKAVLDMCLHHHEKFDGSGYPRQLAGKEIPLIARIGAICDVYDALTTVRPYKRAWTQAEAIDTMMNSPGHFDPDLLKAFVSGVAISGLC